MENLQNKYRVSATKCDRYELPLLKEKIALLLELIGGADQFFKHGSKVLLKPNLLLAREPEKGVTTHPAVVGAVAELALDHGAKVSIGDSPSGGLKSMDKLWAKTGVSSMARKYGVPLLNLEKYGVEARDINFGDLKKVYISKAVLESDLVVNLPKLKTHNLTIITLAMKNSYGCLPGFQKPQLHSMFSNAAIFGALVARIHALIEPGLNIMDGILGMDGRGPTTGDPYWAKMLLASDNALAMDMLLATLMGINPMKIESITEGIKLGVGPGDLSQVELVGGNMEDFRLAGFKVPSNKAMRLMPNLVGRVMSHFFWVYPQVDPLKCTLCKECIKICPTGSISEVHDAAFVERKTCITCFCCVETCEYESIEVKTSLAARRFLSQ